MKKVVLGIMCIVLAPCLRAEEDFTGVPIDVHDLANFMGVTYCGFSFNPEPGQSRVGCVIKEYKIVDGKPADPVEVAAIQCEARVSEDPTMNIFSLMCRKAGDRYQLKLRLNGCHKSITLVRHPFGNYDSVFSVPERIAGLQVLAMKHGPTWASTQPLEGLESLVAIEFLYEGSNVQQRDQRDADDRVR